LNKKLKLLIQNNEIGCMNLKSTIGSKVPSAVAAEARVKLEKKFGSVVHQSELKH
jgi:hypothetical protein